MNVNIGDNIKDLRKGSNMTQSDLADKLRITTSSISAYENGTRMPSYDILIRMARLFKVTTDNLLGFSNKFVADVSGLNAEQRKVIFELIELYKLKNNEDNFIKIDKQTREALNNFDIEKFDVYYRKKK